MYISNGLLRGIYIVATRQLAFALSSPLDSRGGGRARMHVGRGGS